MFYNGTFNFGDSSIIELVAGRNKRIESNNNSTVNNTIKTGGIFVLVCTPGD